MALHVNEAFRTEYLGGELVALDAQRGVVHRISGDALAAFECVREGRPIPADLEDGAAHLVLVGLVVDDAPVAYSRRWLLKAGTAVSAGVVSMGLPRAAAAASGGFSEGDLGAVGDGDPLVVPTITSTTPGNGSVTVQWSTVSGATGYEVYVKRASDSLYTLAGSPSAPTTTLLVSSLSNGTSYQFRVRTVSGAARSALSSIASATPQATVGHPVVSATSTPTSVTVSLDDESGYSYSYALDSGASTNLTGTGSFTVTGLSSATHQLVVTKSGATSKSSRVTLTKTTPSYTASGSISTYTVPANGPRKIKATLRGGVGGRGADAGDYYGGAPGAPGVVTNDYLYVDGGDTVQVGVGSGGGNGTTGTGTGGGTGGTNPFVGFDGGKGGNAGSTGVSGSGGGGGAASVVKHLSGATLVSTIVAAGSGGGGGANFYRNGFDSYYYPGGGSPAVGTTGGAGFPGNQFPLKTSRGGGGGGGGGGFTGGAGGKVEIYRFDAGFEWRYDVYGHGGAAGTNEVNYGTAGFTTEFDPGDDGSISLEYYAVTVTHL